MGIVSDSGKADFSPDFEKPKVRPKGSGKKLANKLVSYLDKPHEQNLTPEVFQKNISPHEQKKIPLAISQLRPEQIRKLALGFTDKQLREAGYYAKGDFGKVQAIQNALQAIKKIADNQKQFLKTFTQVLSKKNQKDFWSTEFPKIAKAFEALDEASRIALQKNEPYKQLQHTLLTFVQQNTSTNDFKPAQMKPKDAGKEFALDVMAMKERDENADLTQVTKWYAAIPNQAAVYQLFSKQEPEGTFRINGKEVSIQGDTTWEKIANFCNMLETEIKKTVPPGTDEGTIKKAATDLLMLGVTSSPMEQVSQLFHLFKNRSISPAANSTHTLYDFQVKNHAVHHAVHRVNSFNVALDGRQPQRFVQDMTVVQKGDTVSGSIDCSDAKPKLIALWKDLVKKLETDSEEAMSLFLKNQSDIESLLTGDLPKDKEFLALRDQFAQFIKNHFLTITKQPVHFNFPPERLAATHPKAPLPDLSKLPEDISNLPLETKEAVKKWYSVFQDPDALIKTFDRLQFTTMRINGATFQEEAEKFSKMRSSLPATRGVSTLIKLALIADRLEEELKKTNPDLHDVGQRQQAVAKLLMLCSIDVSPVQLPPFLHIILNNLDSDHSLRMRGNDLLNNLTDPPFVEFSISKDSVAITSRWHASEENFLNPEQLYPPVTVTSDVSFRPDAQDILRAKYQMTPYEFPPAYLKNLKTALQKKEPSTPMQDLQAHFKSKNLTVMVDGKEYVASLEKRFKGAGPLPAMTPLFFKKGDEQIQIHLQDDGTVHSIKPSSEKPLANRLLNAAYQHVRQPALLIEREAVARGKKDNVQVFYDNETGTVIIQREQKPEDKLQLTISDDGIITSVNGKPSSTIPPHQISWVVACLKKIQ